MQYTIVIDRSRVARVGEDRYFFDNHMNKGKAIDKIASLSEGPLKVQSIFRMTYDGVITEMTVGFNDGKLDLIESRRKNEICN